MGNEEPRAPRAPRTGEASEERIQIAGEALALVFTRLKQAQKILRRDWEQLSPRERSEHSRRVRELEIEHKALLDEIEMNSST